MGGTNLFVREREREREMNINPRRDSKMKEGRE